jgi:TusA-related sulfurtransferase
MQDISKELDVRGYNCPIPMLRTKKALASMLPGHPESHETIVTHTQAKQDPIAAPP